MGLPTTALFGSDLRNRNDGGRFQLDLSRSVQKVGNEYHAHCRIMIDEKRSPNAAEFAPTRKIGRLVDAECREPANMARFPTRLGEDGEDIFERLLELRDQVLAVEMLIGIPADL